MKRWCIIVALIVFTVFAVADIVHDFVTNDAVHYFAERPHRLLLAAGAGIIGGLVALFFDRLSLRLKRSVKLLTLGSAASGLTLVGGYFLFRLTNSLPELSSSDTSEALFLVPLCLGTVAALLWLEFYQILKSPVTRRVANIVLEADLNQPNLKL